jgi:hypothetical protein
MRAVSIKPPGKELASVGAPRPATYDKVAPQIVRGALGFGGAKQVEFNDTANAFLTEFATAGSKKW